MSGEFICETPLPAILLTIIPLIQFGGFLWPVTSERSVSEFNLRKARPTTSSSSAPSPAANAAVARRVATIHRETAARSEEHTSELQSHHDLVCRLLLEKKKTSTK